MLSLYIHIPFCVKKCHYCGFYSTHYSEQLANEFISALSQEAARYGPAFSNRQFETVYIGGGTPTVLSSLQFEGLMTGIKRYFLIDPDAEWTVEANPNTLSSDRLSDMKDQGINRLSLGIQSFSDDVLKRLGRVHTAEEGIEAFTRAKNTGFGSVGIDLIYGIPGQPEEQWYETLSKAIDLKPEHVSTYSLSFDAGSRFREEADADRISLPDEDCVAAQYDLAVNKLSNAGYEHYEISNFSLPGFACRHNMNYWQRGEYLGLGPGAWSFIGNKRYHIVADVRKYIARLRDGQEVHTGEETIDQQQAANETVMLGLRTSMGIDLNHYEREFGPDSLRLLQAKWIPLQNTGLLKHAEGRLRLTNEGFLLAHEVLARLIS
jgi:oxygen-independent coproporphyrinogen-3 oxidase